MRDCSKTGHLSSQPEVRGLISSAGESISEQPRDVADATLRSGARVAHFEMVRLLGLGGFANVYLARDLRLDRDCGGLIRRNVHADCQDVKATIIAEDF